METHTNSNTERSLLDGVRSYLSILLRYKWLIIIITFLSTSAMVAFCVVSVILPPEESPLPNLYSAEAIILVQQNLQNDISNTILEALGVSSESRGSLSFDNGALVMEIMQSRTLLDRLIGEFDLSARYGITESIRGRTREAVTARCEFSYTRNTGVMKISYTDIDPVVSRNVVNRLIVLADDWFSLNRGQEKQKLQEMLDTKLTAVKKDIALLKYRLKTLPDIDPNYSLYAAELDVQQRIYNTLSPQYEAAKLAPEIEPIFRVFEFAEVPDFKSGPRRGQYVLIASGLGFGGAYALALLLNILSTARDVKRRRR
jgi:uncharacterized protein involved in exopolysaccharide biosynthesis